VSASPRRRELLAKLGIPFDVCPSKASELQAAMDGQTLAMMNARLKVERSSFREDRSRVLIGADTVIALDGTQFGKPDDIESARRMLAAMSNRTHEVITGVCISGPAQSSDGPLIEVQAAATSRVRFRVLDSKHIQDYLDTGEWEGKAGAYAIQERGRDLVAGLEGDLDNVIGFPMVLVNDLLCTHFSHCRFL